MNGMKKKAPAFLQVIAILGLGLSICAGAAPAQTAAAQTGPATVQTEVRRGEVVYVSGNNLVVRAEDGQVKNFVVPDDFKFNVDGKQLSVYELTPGMRLTQTITTTTTPKTVRSARTITGKVWYANPPKSVILTLPDGSNKQYTVPKGTKFMVDGRESTVFDLRKGMNVSATVITEMPEVDVRRTATVTGQAPPPVVAEAPPETPEPAGPLLIEVVEVVPEPREEPPARLPKTASYAPLLGLLGLGALGGWLLLRLLGRRTE
ncbi:MAG: hypothetical protein L0Z50_37465 [Verrucomicrobiales bacterium]|nr:hypothetical protein [Verrucomicrobiales bacterium]